MIIWEVNCCFFNYYVKQLPTCIIDKKTNKMYNKFFRIYIDSKEKYPKERFFIESKPERYTIINNETPFKIEYVRMVFGVKKKKGEFIQKSALLQVFMKRNLVVLDARHGKLMIFLQ